MHSLFALVVLLLATVVGVSGSPCDFSSMEFTSQSDVDTMTAGCSSLLGTFAVSESYSDSSLSLSAAITVVNTFTVADTPYLQSLNLQSVQSVLGSLTIRNNSHISTVQLDSATQLGEAYIEDNAELTHFFINFVSNISTVHVQRNPSLVFFVLWSLANIDDSLHIHNNSLLESFLAPSLATIGGDLVITHNANLRNVTTLNALTTVKQSIAISDNAILTALDLAGLVDFCASCFYTDSGFYISNNPMLESIGVPGASGLSALPTATSGARVTFHFDRLPRLTYLSLFPSTPVTFTAAVPVSLVFVSLPLLNQTHLAAGFAGMGGVVRHFEVVDCNGWTSLDFVNLGVVTEHFVVRDMTHLTGISLLGGTSFDPFITIWLSNITLLTSLGDLATYAPTGLSGDIIIANMTQLTDVNWLAPQQPSRLVLAALAALVTLPSHTSWPFVNVLEIRDLPSLASLPTYHFTTFGDLHLVDLPALTSLAGMRLPASLTGGLHIERVNAIADLQGLCLTDCKYVGSLEIAACDSLASLNGLSGLEEITASHLVLSDNPTLTDLAQLSSLKRITWGNFTIARNHALLSLPPLSLTNVDTIFISNNDELASIATLASVNETVRSLEITLNLKLATLQGVERIPNILDTIILAHNPVLDMGTTCLFTLDEASVLTSLLYIANNGISSELNCFHTYDEISNVEIRDWAELTTIDSFSDIQKFGTFTLDDLPSLVHIHATGQWRTFEVTYQLMLRDLPDLQDAVFFDQLVRIGDPFNNGFYPEPVVFVVERTNLATLINFNQVFEVLGSMIIDNNTPRMVTIFDDASALNHIMGPLVVRNSPIVRHINFPTSMTFVAGVSFENCALLEQPAMRANLTVYNNITLTGLPFWQNMGDFSGFSICTASINIFSMPNLVSLADFNIVGSGQRVHLADNPMLVDVSGLDGIVNITSFQLHRCNALQSLYLPLPGVVNVKVWDVNVTNCDNLVSVDIFRNATAVERICILSNPNLIEVRGFHALGEVEEVSFMANQRLERIYGFNSPTLWLKRFVFSDNSNFVSDMAAFRYVTQLESMTIENNEQLVSFVPVTTAAWPEQGISLSHPGAFGFLASVTRSLRVSTSPLLVRLPGQITNVESVVLFRLHQLGTNAAYETGLESLVSTGLVFISECQGITHLVFPSLGSIGSLLSLLDLPDLKVVDVPLLTDIGSQGMLEETFDLSLPPCSEFIVDKLCTPGDPNCAPCGDSSVCPGGGCEFGKCDCRPEVAIYLIALPDLVEVHFPSLEISEAGFYLMQTGMFQLRLSIKTAPVLALYNNQNLFTMRDFNFTHVEDVTISHNTNLCLDVPSIKSRSTFVEVTHYHNSTSSFCQFEQLSFDTVVPATEGEMFERLDLLDAMLVDDNLWTEAELAPGVIEENILGTLSGVMNFTRNAMKTNATSATAATLQMRNSSASTIKKLFQPAAMKRLRAAGVSNTLPGIVEQFSMSLAETLSCGESTSIEGSNLLIEARRSAPENITRTYGSSGAAIYVPPNFGSAVFGASNDCQLMEFSTFQEDPYVPATTQTIKSSVVVFSIDGTQVSNLTADAAVVITLSHTSYTTGDVHTCVWWDSTVSLWKTWGCEVVESTPSATTCRCNHLTSFAVLLDVAGSGDAAALEIISYVGSAFSMVGCTIFIVTFSLLRQLATGPTKLVMNLCVAIFFANLVFLVGIDRVSNASACTASAAFLYFFLMACFCWMLCISHQLFSMLVQLKVKSGNKSDALKPYMLFGWGMPLALTLLIVIIEVANSSALQLGNATNCWIGSQPGLIGAFLVPVLIVIVLNIIVFVLSVRSMERSRRAQRGRKGANEGGHVQTLTVYVSIFITLGVTWLFGYLAIVASAAFWYPFVIFNSAQGLLLCLVYCFRARVRAAWREYLGMRPVGKKKGGNQSKATKSTGVTGGTRGGGGGSSSLDSPSAVSRQATRPPQEICVQVSHDDELNDDNHSGEFLLDTKHKRNNDKYRFATGDVTESMMDEIEQNPEMYGVRSADQEFEECEPTWGDDSTSLELPAELASKRVYNAKYEFTTGDVTDSMIDDLEQNQEMYFGGDGGGRESAEDDSIEMAVRKRRSTDTRSSIASEEPKTQNINASALALFEGGEEYETDWNDPSSAVSLPLPSPRAFRQAHLERTPDAAVSPLVRAAQALGESVAAILNQDVSPMTRRRANPSQVSMQSVDRDAMLSPPPTRARAPATAMLYVYKEPLAERVSLDMRDSIYTKGARRRPSDV